jgi:uncharacterized protein YggE
MAVSPGSTNIAIRRDTAEELKVAAKYACEPLRRRVTGLELADNILHSAMSKGAFELGGVKFSVDPHVIKKEAQEAMDKYVAKSKRLPRTRKKK